MQAEHISLNIFFFCRGNSVVLSDSKETKQSLVAVQHNNKYLFYFMSTTCFSQLTIIRPSLQMLRIRCMKCKLQSRGVGSLITYRMYYNTIKVIGFGLWYMKVVYDVKLSEAEMKLKYTPKSS
jgi:hypothetical protein